MRIDWTEEGMAAGYAAMAKLNLTLAREFATLEEEAAECLADLWMDE